MALSPEVPSVPTAQHLAQIVLVLFVVTLTGADSTAKPTMRLKPQILQGARCAAYTVEQAVSDVDPASQA